MIKLKLNHFQCVFSVYGYVIWECKKNYLKHDERINQKNITLIMFFLYQKILL